MIGKIVDVVIDRPKGTFHPRTNTIFYEVNYGYVPGIIAGDGHEQDVYVLGVDKAIKVFRGEVIAIIHRNDDVEEKWIVCEEGLSFSDEEIMSQINFVEQYYDSYIIRN